MGLAPWETSESQLFALITGANSGLGHAIAARLIEEFITSSETPPTKHLILILCTRTPLKTRFAISRLRAALRKVAEVSAYAKEQHRKARATGLEYNWRTTADRVHFLGVEVDLCDLKSVYALADRLVNGTLGSPDATTMDGMKLPHGSPGTASYSADIKQDRWALAQAPGSIGAQRSWGWGLKDLRIPRLDVVILNAGIGGWTGVDFVDATKSILADLVDAVTWPTYKICDAGRLVKTQSGYKRIGEAEAEKQALLEEQEKPQEPPLGDVFCANLFGHYILAHELMPLLSVPAQPGIETGGRIIWMSTVETSGFENLVKLDDIQALQSPHPYESVKRVIELLALTSELPAARRAAGVFSDPRATVTLKNSNTEVTYVKPRHFVVHPGIFASEILPLNFILVAIYKFVFLVARWLGSPWHTIEPELAAVAPVWTALASQQTIDQLAVKDGKWGSATDRAGNERVMRTEVPGWGWDGTIGGRAENGRRGTRKGTMAVTKEAREDFEEMGAKCWAQMEGLRKEWEGILGVNGGK